MIQTISMGERFVINGPSRLRGEIEVRGSKNAVLPIIAATLLTSKPCSIDNVPRIEDVYRMLEVLESIGATVTWGGTHNVQIYTKRINARTLDSKLVSKLRASVLLLGPLAARVGKVLLPYPGGDHIGRRPLDAHINAFRSLGARVRVRHDHILIDASKGLRGEEVILDEFSVTATENILMASSLAVHKRRIKMAALEPHVGDLILFLKKLGVKIHGEGSHTLTIQGSRALRGATHSVTYDSIEAGTFIVLGALSQGHILVKNVNPAYLELFFKKLRDIGVRFHIEKGKKRNCSNIRVWHSGRLKSFKVQALPFPGIPTDLQALLGLLATQARGASIIHDPLYENRFNYARELRKMGAQVKFLDPHRTEFTGPTKLAGVRIKSFDLRAGATLIIAGLIARGKTVISDAYQVDRGYEKIEERLQKLGANIQRV